MKKLLSALLLNFLLCQATTASAEQSSTDEGYKTPFSQLNAGFLYSYTDFDFNSTTENNHHRFQGHSNLYSVGAGNVQLGHDMLAGLSIYRVNTRVHSQSKFEPAVPVHNHQDIRNNTILGHVLKFFKPSFFLDLAGAYGQNTVRTESLLLPESTNIVPEQGYAKSTNTNWFASLTAIYVKPWNDWIFSGNVRTLYSQINAPSYVMRFSPTLPTQIIEPLTNRVFFLMESLEARYKWKPEIMPFVNGGLIQVLSFRNSRPLTTIPINGTLPQLSVNKNGFRVGAGVAMQYHRLSLRLEEQYLRTSNTFRTYQTLGTVRYQIG